jgi:uncharacterized membrane protein YedE/YeeE
MHLAIVAFIIGIVFSIGLGWSGMTDPARVLGFLDVSGSWDPSLMFVMASAIPVYMVVWQFVRPRHKPLLDEKLHVPTKKDLDKRLIIGSAIFGVGWGVAGICPGPALTSLGALSTGAVVFVICYFIGAKLEGFTNAN